MTTRKIDDTFRLYEPWVEPSDAAECEAVENFYISHKYGCNAEMRNWVCTRRLNHDGKHVAANSKLVCASWAERSPKKHQDTGIGRVADFEAAEEAVRKAFRWYCCDKNADQKGCEPGCPRKQALDGLQRGREILLKRKGERSESVSSVGERVK